MPVVSPANQPPNVKCAIGFSAQLDRIARRTPVAVRELERRQRVPLLDLDHPRELFEVETRRAALEAEQRLEAIAGIHVSGDEDRRPH
jgi:hypothetical protein